MCLLTSCWFVEFEAAYYSWSFCPLLDLVEIDQWVGTLFKQRQHGCNFLIFFLMDFRNVSGTRCLSLKITYFIAFCWRTVIPNNRSQLWKHHVLSGRAGKAGPGYSSMLGSLYWAGHRLWAVLLCCDNFYTFHLLLCISSPPTFFYALHLVFLTFLLLLLSIFVSTFQCFYSFS